MYRDEIANDYQDDSYIDPRYANAYQEAYDDDDGQFTDDIGPAYSSPSPPERNMSSVGIDRHVYAVQDEIDEFGDGNTYYGEEGTLYGNGQERQVYGALQGCQIHAPLISSSSAFQSRPTGYVPQQYDEVERGSYDNDSRVHLHQPPSRPFIRSLQTSAASHHRRPYQPFQSQPQYHQPPPALAPHVSTGSQSTHPLHYSENQIFPEVPKPLATPPRGAGLERLRPTTQLPDRYRAMYNFGVFNRVQSACYDDVMNTNENLVISAPTGSGKTVLFELAIIRMQTEAEKSGQRMKCVYMAPTKALCSERHRDWSAKFSTLGIQCCELTGDTVHSNGKGAWGDAKQASIIITTGEKWDSLTRHWGEHGQILSQIQLFLVDEVHILNESRGSTLEVVISRMKLRGNAVRFLLVSATVPNIHDIAAWIGSDKGSENPAKVFQFGESYRPCQLKRIVVGVHRGKKHNDFQFAKTLDFKLFNILQTYSVGKPMLVFVSTRKGVFATADQLFKEYTEAEKKRETLPWTHPARIDHPFSDKRLSVYAVSGIGVHHAGLALEDRRAVEELYLAKKLRIVVCTSTLAVGINLPAHTVVIKGVQIYQNGANVEISDLDIMQMIGRAGRPQFDKEGTAIIICESELEAKYNALVSGTTVLESSLHLNLSEHLNSEIGLGTINNIDSAKDWLKKSFLFQRIKKNPRHYALGKDEGQTWEARVDDLVQQSVDKLKSTELIEHEDDTGTLTSTEYGDIMSKFYIRQATMGSILALPERPTLRDILEMISSADELGDTKLRASEKTSLNNLKKHNDIRFSVKKVEKTSDKCFLLIQAILGGISLNTPEYKNGDSQLGLEAFGVFRHTSRIARAVVEVAIARKRGAQLRYGLELVRCFTAKAWEDRPVVLRQIESVGEKSIKVLAEHGITSLQILRKQDPLRIEKLLNRRPPFGLEVLASMSEFPVYIMKVTEKALTSHAGSAPVEVELSVECQVEEQKSIGKSKKHKQRFADMTTVMTLNSDNDFIDFRRIPTKALKQAKTFEVMVDLEKPSQSIHVYISSESHAGVSHTQHYKPNLPPQEYPTKNTKPLNAIEHELVGLEDFPDLWTEFDVDANDDDEPEKPIPVRDLTKPKDKNQPAEAKTQKMATTEDQPPAKLPNGKYQCNHPCKDKQHCRHFCCRDGLQEPPKHPKLRSTAENIPRLRTGSSTNPESTVFLVRPASKPKKAMPARVDHTLENLESLHKLTNVQSSLKMPEGRRLKLPNAPRKRVLASDFNVEFTDLREPDDDTSHLYSLPDLDDDELPEVIPGRVDKKPSSEDTFSDPEMDALIRDLPLNDIPKTSSEKKIGSAKRVLPSDPTCSSDARPSKRIRTEQGHSDHASLSYPLPFAMGGARSSTSSKTTEEPLFIGDSDEEDQASKFTDNFDYDVMDISASFDNDEADFTLDSTYIENRSLTLDLATPGDALSGSTQHELKQLSSNANIEDIQASKDAMVEDGLVEEVDEFAEFDAWLNSGAVKIT